MKNLSAETSTTVRRTWAPLLLLPLTLLMAGCPGGRSVQRDAMNAPPDSLEDQFVADDLSEIPVPFDVDPWDLRDLPPDATQLDAQDLTDAPPEDLLSETELGHWDILEDDLPNPDATDAISATAGAGEPCTGDENCENGTCMDTQWGRFCVPPCANSKCPQGWQCVETDAGVRCVPFNPPTCEKCSSSTCPEAWCRDVGLEGSFCMAPCLEHVHCPPDFKCLFDDSLGLSLCTPNIQSCRCTQKDVGKLVSCTITNEFGACTGKGLCTVDVGVVECDAPVAQPEFCDGLDNNCDSIVDDPWPKKGKPCDGQDADLCLTGVSTCGPDGLSLVCTGEIPQFESCDGKDNDCDGLTDEDFPDINGDGVADCLQ